MNSIINNASNEGGSKVEEDIEDSASDDVDS